MITKENMEYEIAQNDIFLLELQTQELKEQKFRELQQENKQLKENYKLIDKSMSELIEENQQLKQKYLNAVADYESEKSKNYNAIEYIKNNSAFINNDEYEVFNKKELLEILKGDNNE